MRALLKILVRTAAVGSVMSACSLLDVPNNVDPTGALDAAPPDGAPSDAAGADGSEEDAPKDSGSDSPLSEHDAADARSACVFTHGSQPVATGYGFCIDPVEVTYSQFEEFLQAMGEEFRESHGVSGAALQMDQRCGPQAWPTEGTVISSDGPQGAALPTTYCQAKAYCEWAGKHLCGRIGGGTLTTYHSQSSGDPVNDPTQSEWYLACSRDGGRKYPFGDTFDAQACNLDTNSRATSLPWRGGSCAGGIDGVFDMAGNANEWIDSCGVDADGGYRCHLRGGSAFTASTLVQKHASCALEGNPPPFANMWEPLDAALTNQAWSFRCCSDEIAEP